MAAILSPSEFPLATLAASHLAASMGRFSQSISGILGLPPLGPGFMSSSCANPRIAKREWCKASA